MEWNNHYNLKDTHAFLSPSAKAWVNYTDEKLGYRYFNSERTRFGTELHALASRAIKLRQYISEKSILICNYVNDCIDFNMDVDVVLFYSRYCYGTCDAIKYDPKSNSLYIFDLKTGKTKADFMQLYIYTALFILEYDIVPERIICRIYQRDEMFEERPEKDYILELVENIINKSNILESIDNTFEDFGKRGYIDGYTEETGESDGDKS